MLHHRALNKSWLAVGVLALLLAGSVESLGFELGSLPPSPCPCAADGVCRPNRDSWGHYKTRWRSWPGETLGQQPTMADDAMGSEGEQPGLEPFELPLPEHENLRGPATKDKTSDDEVDDTPADANLGDVPEQLLPGPEALPAFDPQGNHLEIPGQDDAPPALPASLQQAALSLKTPVLKIPVLKTPALNMPQRLSHQRPPAVRSLAAPATASRPVRQASWQQNSIQLINPASAIVLEPGANNLQQAIYYEASDQSEKLAK